MARNRHDAMSDLSPLSGAERKSDYGSAKVSFDQKPDFLSCSFLSRNDFHMRKVNEQLRNSISGHGFAE